MKVSFWAYRGIETDTENGTEADAFLRVELEEGESFEWSEGRSTDEGHYAVADRYTLEDGIVTLERATDACDCDGPLVTSRVYTCPVANLRDVENYCGLMMPAWEEVSASQRDVYAEQMGY